jgi:sigma-B regulation protein RsbU (phosphoserine phosphatase)
LRGDEVVRLSEGGMPLGMFENRRYDSRCHQLAAGDLLVMFTDGVVETPNADDEEFGAARLIELLRSSGDRPLDDVIHSVLKELDAWSDGAEAHDDVTLVLARMT